MFSKGLNMKDDILTLIKCINLILDDAYDISGYQNDDVEKVLIALVEKYDL